MAVLDIHADDYAVSLHTSQDILECLRRGCLNSISIIPNNDSLIQSMQLLQAEWDTLPVKPEISIHINLIDGDSLAGKEAILLCDENGYCRAKWGRLFIQSWVPGKKHREMKQELKTEIRAQIERCIPFLPKPDAIRIDSHQHTHMIPIVAKALLEVIDEEAYPVSFVRSAREPLDIFLKKFSLYPGYSTVNFVKNMILNLCAGGLEKGLRKRNISYGLLWGLVMSGHMDWERIEALLPDMKVYAKAKNKDLEILFHPGRMQANEVTPQACKPEVNEFYLSENRDIERNAVMQLSGRIN